MEVTLTAQIIILLITTIAGGIGSTFLWFRSEMKTLRDELKVANKRIEALEFENDELRAKNAKLEKEYAILVERSNIKKVVSELLAQSNTFTTEVKQYADLTKVKIDNKSK